MGSRDGVLSGYGQKSYTDWTWPDDMVYRLDLGIRGGVLTEHGQDR